MKHIFKFVALVGIALTLNGCSSVFGQKGYLRDKSDDYVGERMTPNLVLPENLNPVEPMDYMPIPSLQIDEVIEKARDAPRADRRIVREDGATYMVATHGDTQVLLTQHPPAELWDHALQFWKSEGFTIAKSDPAAGVMETDWALLDKASRPGALRSFVGWVVGNGNTSGMMEKFRLSIRRGTRSGGGSLVLEHARRSSSANLEEPIDWSDSSEDSTRLENKLLNKMLIHLVLSRDEQKASFRPHKLDVDSQTTLVKDGNGNPVLRIEQNFNYSWQAIEEALAKAGIEVQDRNRTAGLIFVRMATESVSAPQEESKGWFSRLFSSDSEDKPMTGQNEYLIRVLSPGPVTNVTLEKDLNTLPPAEFSEAFLERLRDNLD